MKIGFVGYQGSGKSTLFGWLTGVTPDPALSHTTQTAMAEVPDPRVDQLCAIYHPKKIVLAALELMDTPGLDPEHEGNAARLSLLRECGCLVHVVNAYSEESPQARLVAFDEDLLLADMEIVSRRVERL
ncbi:MAG: 50S ribosome-binding GTPase, partial [Planctomycetota bacterium]|nr:50S ribosome-binding GTPase [Planctomycetota bacterium]